MKRITLMVLFALSVSAVADVYRWTDPATGAVQVTPTVPPYPVKQERIVGKLPNGYMVELTLDANAPEVKTLIEKRKAQEAEKKRIAEEKAREQAAREAEQQRIAEEKAKERTAREAEERRIAEEKAKEQAVQAAQEEEKERARRVKLEAETKRLNKEIEEQEKKVAEAQREVDKEKKKREELSNKNISKAVKSKDKDVVFMLGVVKEFTQYQEFASRTARIQLAIPINNLLGTKAKLDSYETSKCYKNLKRQLQEWMGLSIKVYYEFAAQNEDASEKYKELSNDLFVDLWANYPESCGWFHGWF